MENINKILERQCTSFEFENGKVKYFSISTQHDIADTIDEAIKNIIKCDKKYGGKSSFAYAIEKFENRLKNEHDL